MVAYRSGVGSRAWLVAVAALALAGCSSWSKEKPAPDENAYPANFKSAIVATVTSAKTFDPTNIREASIADPELKEVAGSATRYVVCVRFNPRNDARQYTGLADYVAYFYAGDVTQLVKATGGQCAGAAYKPFPELEKICFAQKCP